jgi:hypothetical protein
MGLMNIDRDDLRRALGKKSRDQRAPNATAGTRDDNVFPFNVHIRVSPDRVSLISCHHKQMQRQNNAALR